MTASPKWQPAAAAAAGSAAAQLAVPLLFAVVARRLPAVELATVRQFLVIQSVVLVACALGTPTAMLHRLGLATDDDERRRVYATALMWFAITTLLAAAITGALVKAAGSVLLNPILSSSALIAAVASGLAMHSMFAGSLLVSMRWFRTYIVLGIAQVLIACISAWLLTARTPRAFNVIAAIAIANAVGWLATAAAFRAGSSNARSTRMGESVRYGGPVAVSSTLYALSYQLDHFVASRALPLATYALYAAGAWQLPIGPLVQRAQSDAFLPLLAASHDQKKTSEFWHAWRAIIDPFAMIGALLFWTVFPIANEVTVVAFGAHYAASSTVLRIYTLLIPLRMVALTLPMRAAGFTRLDVLACAIFGAVNLAAGTLLTPHFELIGPALGLVAGFVAWVMVSLIGTSRAMSVDMLTILPIRMIAATFAIAGVFAALPSWAAASMFAAPVARIVSYLACYAALVAAGALLWRRRTRHRARVAG